MKLDMNIDEYLPLREVVFHTLRKAIIQGELQPGERLKIGRASCRERV